MKRKILSTLLILTIVLSSLCIIPLQSNAETEATTSTIIMRLNSKKAFLNHEEIAVDTKNPDVSPFTLIGKTMVPVRFVENLGAEVNYYSTEEPVTVKYGNIELSLSFGNDLIKKTVNGGEIEYVHMPTAPTLIEGKTCVPIREIAESLGFSVSYNSSTYVIVVSTSPLSDEKLNAEMKYGKDNLPAFVEGVKSITAKKVDVSLPLEKTFQIPSDDITFFPAQVGCRLLRYSSSDPGTASVTSQGKITGVSDGMANITVSSHNGKVALIRVKVGTGIPDPSTPPFYLFEANFVPFASAVMPSKLNGVNKYPVSCEYDLNGDGKVENISFRTPTEENGNIRTILTVNETTIEIFDDGLAGIEIVDVDLNDKFREIAIYFEGPSDDPITYFFRYDGTKLIKLGSISGRWWDGSTSLVTTLYGCLIDTFSNTIDFTDPAIAMQFYQVVDNEIKLINNAKIDDPNNHVYGKEFPVSPLYTVGQPLHGRNYIPRCYFVEHEEVPEDSWNDTEIFITDEEGNWVEDTSKIHTFQAGDTITILKIGNPYTAEITYSPIRGTWYYVQLSDGRKGVLFFPIAD